MIRALAVAGSLATFALLTTPAPGSVVWMMRATEVRAADPSMCYDATNHVCVCFGGYTSRSNTLAWNGSAWALPSITGPSPRFGHVMAFDSFRDRTVLFGGSTGAVGNTVSNNETWEWNGNAWTSFGSGGPSPRQYSAMAYDSDRHVAVLFGGATANGLVGVNGETWERTGTTWALRPGTGPSARVAHAMVYDSDRHVTVLFGGATSINGTMFTASDETWELGAGGWMREGIGVPGPSARVPHAMAYDNARHVTVLFGGYVGGTVDNPVFGGDTWEWNGTAWFQQPIVGPAPRAQHTMTFDSLRSVTVLQSGYTNTSTESRETWELCTTPSFTAQPAPRVVCPTGSAAFGVTAAGSGPLSYQWQIQTSLAVWTSLGNDPLPLPCGGGAFGYATPINSASVMIGLRPCPGSRTSPQHIQVRCLVTNPCGSVTSNVATYAICPGDFNCTGDVGVQDIFDFLFAYFAADPRADINGVGGVTVQDVFDFLVAYFIGCP